MAGIICKIALSTVGRYGFASLVMLCVGFLFLITTSNSFQFLRQELTAPYVLSVTVNGSVDLERYSAIDSVEAVTPVLRFDTKLSIPEASLSAEVTAVTAEYLDLTFSQGGPFPNGSNMPFLILNQYAAEHFQTEDKKTATVSVNDTVTMTIGEEERSAIVCGIFEDGQEKPEIYMSYTLAAQSIPKEETISLLLRLKETGELESAAKALKKLNVSAPYDEGMPQRWQLTKQQIYQSFASALILLLCSAVQMAGCHKREQREALPERQALGISGIDGNRLRWIFPLRTLFAGLLCSVIALAVATAMGSFSPLGLLMGSLAWAGHWGVVIVWYGYSKTLEVV